MYICCLLPRQLGRYMFFLQFATLFALFILILQSCCNSHLLFSENGRFDLLLWGHAKVLASQIDLALPHAPGSPERTETAPALLAGAIWARGRSEPNADLLLTEDIG